MGSTKVYQCKNIEGKCPLALDFEKIEITEGAKFVCPLRRAECEKNLELIRPPQAPWKRLLKKLVIAAVPVLAIILIWWYVRGHQPPPSPTAKTSVVIVVDGQILNPVMVRTPSWLGDWAAGFSHSNSVLSFGLWGCRPVETNGEMRTPLRNYAPTLMPLEDFRKLQISSAPKPDQWPEALRKGSPSYDLFSDLKAILHETRWDSPTNRFLVIITETSAFPKSSEKNTAGIDELEVKRLADEAHVRVFAIHVIVPSDLMADDQRLAERQLRAVCESGGRNSYYAVQSSAALGRSTEGELQMVTAYVDGLKAAFGQILERFLEPPRN